MKDVCGWWNRIAAGRSAWKEESYTHGAGARLDRPMGPDSILSALEGFYSSGDSRA